MSIKVETIKMHCERCKIPTSTMVALPRRRHKDGTVICFWQLCLKCAREVLNGKKDLRDLSKVRVSEDIKSRQTKKSHVLRKVQDVVRRVKNDKKCKEKDCKKQHKKAGKQKKQQHASR